MASSLNRVHAPADGRHNMGHALAIFPAVSVLEPSILLKIPQTASLTHAVNHAVTHHPSKACPPGKYNVDEFTCSSCPWGQFSPEVHLAFPCAKSLKGGRTAASSDAEVEPALMSVTAPSWTPIARGGLYILVHVGSACSNTHIRPTQTFTKNASCPFQRTHSVILPWCPEWQQVLPAVPNWYLHKRRQASLETAYQL